MEPSIIIPLVLAAFLLFRFIRRASNQIVIPENPYLVDVRTTKEFNSGSVKGAINIPLSQIESRLSELKGKENIVVFCRSGNRSGQAKAILEKNGFINIVNGGSWGAVKNKIER